MSKICKVDEIRINQAYKADSDYFVKLINYNCKEEHFKRIDLKEISFLYKKKIHSKKIWMKTKRTLIFAFLGKISRIIYSLSNKKDNAEYFVNVTN